mmetsp:Transcript_10147/g.14655  ORF Transcript_10147/g.14655 Transcript_10147/m.14655 type:complete len:99 (+) Transcript_10147:122-418(+)
MAFVGSGIFLGRRVSPKVVLRSGAVARRVKTRGGSRVSMAKETNSMEDPDTRKLGFVHYSEKLNGRIAMIAFVVIVFVEIIDPSHPTIFELVNRITGN